MPPPLRQLATRRGEALSFSSDILERAKALLRGSQARPIEFYNQLKGKVLEAPLDLMFRDTLRQPPRVMPREEFLASARPPGWKAAAVRRNVSEDDDALHEAALDILANEPYASRVEEAIRAVAASLPHMARGGCVRSPLKRLAQAGMH